MCLFLDPKWSRSHFFLGGSTLLLFLVPMCLKERGGMGITAKDSHIVLSGSLRDVEGRQGVCVYEGVHRGKSMGDPQVSGAVPSPIPVG